MKNRKSIKEGQQLAPLAQKATATTGEQSSLRKNRRSI
jgi:hypothetical protein